MPTYLLKIVRLNPRFVGTAVLLITIANMLTSLAIAFISHHVRLHLNQLFKTLSLLCIPLVAVSYWLISMNTFMLTGLLLLGAISGIFTMMAPAIITTLFPANIRLSGVALCYNLGFTIFGGLAPVIITSCINVGADKFLTPALFIAIIFLASSISMHFHKHVNQ